MLGEHVEIRGGPGRRWLVVPWHAAPASIAADGPRTGVRRLSATEARAVLRLASQDPVSAGRLAALAVRAGHSPAAGRALTELARQLDDGRLIVLELADLDPTRRLDATPPRPRHVDPAEPEGFAPSEPQRTTQLRVRVVLDDGVPLSGANVTLTAPDGRRAEVVAGGGGEARMDEIAADGPGQAEVRPRQVPRWLGGSQPPLFAEHIFDLPFDVAVTAGVPTGALATIVLRRPEIERVDGACLEFAPDSSLLVPLVDGQSPAQALLAAVARLQAEPPCRLLIVGHASADGGAEANHKLAQRRAECVHHLLVDARDAWVELAAEHGSPADVQRLLLHLARVHDWPTDPTRVDGVVDKHMATAVSAFQEHYNGAFDGSLDVDGVCGKQTLAALFDVQRHELRMQRTALDIPDGPLTWFNAAGLISAGARVLAHPAIPESQAAPGQRRVDLLLLGDPLAWREQHGIERLYDAARIRTLPTAPLAVGRADLILTLVDHYGRTLADQPYELFTDTEVRTGTSDAQGRVVERGLDGRVARLECDGCIVIIDDAYHRVTKLRHALAATMPAGDDDDDDDNDDDLDAPLPAVDEDDGDGLDLDDDLEDDDPDDEALEA